MKLADFLREKGLRYDTPSLQPDLGALDDMLPLHSRSSRTVAFSSYFTLRRRG